MGHFLILQKDIITIIYRILRTKQLKYLHRSLYNVTFLIDDKLTKFQYYNKYFLFLSLFIDNAIINGTYFVIRQGSCWTTVSDDCEISNVKWKFNNKGHRIMA